MTVVFLCLAAVSLFTVGSLSAPVAAQDDGNITIERDNNTLSITVDEAIAGSFQEGNITVNDGNDSVERFQISPSDTGDATRDIELLSISPETDLRNASINVRLLNQTGDRTAQQSERKDLRAVEFGSKSDIVLSGRNLTIPVANVTGTGSKIQLAVSSQAQNESTPLSVPLKKTNGTARINLLTPSLHQEINIFGGVSIEAFPHSETARTSFLNEDPLSLLDRDSDNITLGDEDQLLFKSNLIFDGTSYDISVDGNKIPPRTNDASGFGTLQIRENILRLGRTNVSITDTTWGVEVATTPIPFENSAIFERATELTTPTITGTTSGTVVEHPLFFTDQKYVLNVTTRNPNGTFYRTISAEDNQIAFEKNISIADEIIISATDVDDRLIFENRTDELIEQIPINGTIAENKLNLTSAFEQSEGIDPESVENALLRHNGTVFTGAGINNNGSINLSNVEPAPTVGDSIDILLTQSDGSPVRLNVTVNEPVSGSSDQTTGTSVPVGVPEVVILLSVLSLVIVIGGSYISHRPSTDSFSIIYNSEFVLAVTTIICLSLLTGIMLRFLFSPIFSLSGFIAAFLLSLTIRDIIDTVETNRIHFASFVVAIVLFVITVPFAVRAGKPGTIVVGGGHGVIAVITASLAYKQIESARGESSNKSQSTQVSVKIVDKMKNSQIGSEIELDVGDSNSVSKSITGGQGTVNLDSGKWAFVATVSGREITRVTEFIHQGQSQSVQITLYGIKQTIKVKGKIQSNGERELELSDADVKIDAPGFTDQGLTDQNGTYTTELPLELSATAEVRAEHQSFQADSRRIGPFNDVIISIESIEQQSKQSASRSSAISNDATSTELELPPREGTISATAMLDRDPVPDVEVTATRQAEPRQTVSGQTDTRGRAELADVLVGKYRVDANLPVSSDAFELSPDTVTVREDQTAQGRITIQFNYSLSRTHRDRINDLRGQLNDIARSSRRDDAIQRYYASTLQAVLDEIERIPRSGRTFIRHNQDPNAVVEDVLSATEQATELLDTVLSSKRNVDLFSACSELPDASVKWPGDVDISNLLSLTADGVGQQRAEVNNKIESVDERITSERRELAEVSPAREMWEGIKEMIRDQRGGGEHSLAATIFISLVLLGAVEMLFDQRELRERLGKTVY